MGRPAPGALTEVGSQFSPAVSLPINNKLVVATQSVSHSLCCNLNHLNSLLITTTLLSSVIGGRSSVYRILIYDVFCILFLRLLSWSFILGS